MNRCKEWYDKNREHVLLYKKQYYKDNKRYMKNMEVNRQYGMSLDEIEYLKISQDNKCKICDKNAVLDIDHCHVTHKVRGLLCKYCNTRLGWFESYGGKVLEYLAEKTV